eukprot:CAMPEP_0196826988 /NCGR_PEP_ID=MMETSP1362-20130617/93919_1 /TAXON_ID=163516 /ORGANISM="Leptocylindrus danicus, Strain CCMP1856" /LENGTH=652 /DNA_ID=CAMNT_0042207599 /DNA_START=140 /DNA_END=2098 /DNA_ORIENTATION=+
MSSDNNRKKRPLPPSSTVVNKRQCTTPSITSTADYSSPSIQSASISNDNNENNKTNQKLPSNRPVPMFLQKLFHMLETATGDPRMSPIVSWSEHHNDCFCIHNVQAFSSQVIPKYFESTMSSFKRQLNYYGFQKINDAPLLLEEQASNSDTSVVAKATSKKKTGNNNLKKSKKGGNDLSTMTYRHEHGKFQRNRPDLLPQVRRATRAVDPKAESAELREKVTHLEEEVLRLTDELRRIRGEMTHFKSFIDQRQCSSSMPLPSPQHATDQSPTSQMQQQQRPLMLHPPRSAGIPASSHYGHNSANSNGSAAVPNSMTTTPQKRQQQQQHPYSSITATATTNDATTMGTTSHAHAHPHAPIGMYASEYGSISLPSTNAIQPPGPAQNNHHNHHNHHNHNHPHSATAMLPLAAALPRSRSTHGGVSRFHSMESTGSIAPNHWAFLANNVANAETSSFMGDPAAAAAADSTSNHAHSHAQPHSVHDVVASSSSNHAGHLQIPSHRPLHQNNGGSNIAVSFAQYLQSQQQPMNMNINMNVNAPMLQGAAPGMDNSSNSISQNDWQAVEGLLRASSLVGYARSRSIDSAGSIIVEREEEEENDYVGQTCEDVFGAAAAEADPPAIAAPSGSPSPTGSSKSSTSVRTISCEAEACISNV